MDRNEKRKAALHEAGHAVMARLLGITLKKVWIKPSKASVWGEDWTGNTSVDWNGAVDPCKDLQIAMAARACLRVFGISTLLDHGGISDEAKIETLLEVKFDEQEEEKRAHLRRIDLELERRFAQSDARGAAEALAKILNDQLEIDGAAAERLIDAHLTA